MAVLNGLDPFVAKMLLPKPGKVGKVEKGNALRIAHAPGPSIHLGAGRSSTPAGDLPRKSAAITKVLKELVAEEKVAAADITRLGCYRGEAFAWAWLANEGHPAYMGHIMMAEMIAPFLTHKDRRYPE
jgi:hypothetical protein